MYVCIWWHVSTRSIERISTSFLCSYSIWDDEWWWVSRLDLMMRSRLDLWDCVSISTRKFYQISTRFYVWVWGFFRPLGWQTARLMLRSLSPQHLDTFYSEYLQILDGLLNHIKHSFIFNKPFNNIKWGVFCIIAYIFALWDSFVYLNGL